MKYPVFLALFSALLVFGRAAETPSSAKVQNGRLSTVQLIATARAPGKGAPDGIAFLFLVTRTEAGKGQFTLNETRDFQIAGESYQAKTQAELGKKFEPGTIIDNAEKFFDKQPGLRKRAPEKIEGATVLTIAIGGAPLPASGMVDITVHVGFEKEVESFTFTVPIPAPRAAKSKA